MPPALPPEAWQQGQPQTPPQTPTPLPAPHRSPPALCAQARAARALRGEDAKQPTSPAAFLEANADRFGMLIALANASDAVGALLADPPAPVTLLLPTDEAFESAGLNASSVAALLEGLEGPSADALRAGIEALLSAHVLPELAESAEDLVGDAPRPTLANATALAFTRAIGSGVAVAIDGCEACEADRAILGSATPVLAGQDVAIYELASGAGTLASLAAVAGAGGDVVVDKGAIASPFCSPGCF